MRRRLVILMLTGLVAAACSSGHRGAATAPVTRGATAAVDAVQSAPVTSVATPDGTVGYRTVGRGPAIVLIMGYGGSVDAWDPAFVAALATDHRVVMVDNAGVGRTAALPGPLSMTAMAGQVSAAITALHLGRPAVLGWSMGGMIAQALAVTHPSQVSKLILCATLSGDGKAALPPPAVAARLAQPSSSGGGVDLLFPGDAASRSAATAYIGRVSGYRQFDPAPSSTVKAQYAALVSWSLGYDPSGPGIGRLAPPTLVADGTDDLLIPEANAVHLARVIRGARLVLYRGAGHAFLFQDEAAFVPVLRAFLAR